MRRRTSKTGNAQYVDTASPGVDFHEPTGTYRTEFDLASSFPSEAVIRGVAHAADCSPLDLPPLFSTIDPDALDVLFTPTTTNNRRATVSVSFDYAGYVVTIKGHGMIEVGPQDTAPE